MESLLVLKPYLMDSSLSFMATFSIFILEILPEQLLSSEDFIKHLLYNKGVELDKFIEFGLSKMLGYMFCNPIYLSYIFEKMCKRILELNFGYDDDIVISLLDRPAVVYPYIPDGLKLVVATALCISMNEYSSLCELRDYLFRVYRQLESHAFVVERYVSKMLMHKYAGHKQITPFNLELFNAFMMHSSADIILFNHLFGNILNSHPDLRGKDPSFVEKKITGWIKSLHYGTVLCFLDLITERMNLGLSGDPSIPEGPKVPLSDEIRLARDWRGLKNMGASGWYNRASQHAYLNPRTGNAINLVKMFNDKPGFGGIISLIKKDKFPEVDLRGNPELKFVYRCIKMPDVFNLGNIETVVDSMYDTDITLGDLIGEDNQRKGLVTQKQIKLFGMPEGICMNESNSLPRDLLSFVQELNVHLSLQKLNPDRLKRKFIEHHTLTVDKFKKIAGKNKFTPKYDGKKVLIYKNSNGVRLYGERSGEQYTYDDEIEKRDSEMQLDPKEEEIVVIEGLYGERSGEHDDGTEKGDSEMQLDHSEEGEIVVIEGLSSPNYVECCGNAYNLLNYFREYTQFVKSFPTNIERVVYGAVSQQDEEVNEFIHRAKRFVILKNKDGLNSDEKDEKRRLFDYLIRNYEHFRYAFPKKIPNTDKFNMDKVGVAIDQFFKNLESYEVSLSYKDEGNDTQLTKENFSKNVNDLIIFFESEISICIERWMKHYSSLRLEDIPKEDPLDDIYPPFNVRCRLLAKAYILFSNVSGDSSHDMVVHVLNSGIDAIKFLQHKNTVLSKGLWDCWELNSIMIEDLPQRQDQQYVEKMIIGSLLNSLPPEYRGSVASIISSKDLDFLEKLRIAGSIKSICVSPKTPISIAHENTSIPITYLFDQHVLYPDKTLELYKKAIKDAFVQDCESFTVPWEVQAVCEKQHGAIDPSIVRVFVQNALTRVSIKEPIPDTFDELILYALTEFYRGEPSPYIKGVIEGIVKGITDDNRRQYLLQKNKYNETKDERLFTQPQIVYVKRLVEDGVMINENISKDIPIRQEIQHNLRKFLLEGFQAYIETHNLPAEEVVIVDVGTPVVPPSVGPRSVGPPPAGPPVGDPPVGGPSVSDQPSQPVAVAAEEVQSPSVKRPRRPIRTPPVGGPSVSYQPSQPVAAEEGVVQSPSVKRLSIPIGPFRPPLITQSKRKSRAPLTNKNFNRRSIKSVPKYFAVQGAFQKDSQASQEDSQEDSSDEDEELNPYIPPPPLVRLAAKKVFNRQGGTRKRRNKMTRPVHKPLHKTRICKRKTRKR